MKSFDVKKIEKKWQEFWASADLYHADDFSKKKKYYCLVEFPYPSGEGLHIGHGFTMTGADVFARKKRQEGYNVLFPIGYDAFGLPTENYAIKKKIQPAVATKQNTDCYREQMKKLAFSFDWTREVNTTDPGYYKWTQWIFIQLFKNGLAFKDERPINWCPSCKVGLANEEVVNGKCERCGAEATRKNLSQWVVKITEYADRLIEGLEHTDFVKKVKTAQINWIDRKEWIDITYPVEGIDWEIVVATTRPDTNFGATFVVLAPEHPLVDDILGGKIKTHVDVTEIRTYVGRALKKSELERQQDVESTKKTGVFTGLYAVNQLNGYKMPIYITDFVLMSVGTGAVVGVPGHDVRDFDFAKTFGLPVVRVVTGKDGDVSEITRRDQVQEDEGTMVNSGFIDGLDIHDATKKIMDYLEEKGWGKRTIRYHLRDWIFSRQHYWGEPIPMISCQKCGWVPVPEEELPVRLPDVEHYEPTDTGESPLAAMTEWVNVTCPTCGGPAQRETDTMPNWAGSDWYFLRYTDPRNDSAMAEMKKMAYWMPVDLYIGGDEHNTLHLLYSRFIYHFLRDIGAVPKRVEEPYSRRISHGVILGPDGQRMSKSRGNVIVPGTISDEYGSDIFRTYAMFMGPFDSTMAWNDNALKGVERFLDRFYVFVTSQVGKISDDGVQKTVAKLVTKVSADIDAFRFNTAIAAFMEVLNTIEKKQISREDALTMVKLMAPFAPYISEELWHVLGEKGSVHLSRWPVVSGQDEIEMNVEIPIQINGKVRGRVTVPADASEQEVTAAAKGQQNVAVYLTGKTVQKSVYVQGKILTLVVQE